MRYPTSEKLEIIKLVEQSHLPVRRTLEKLGIARATFYHWYGLYRSGGPEALADRRSRPSRVWNRIPDPMREKIVRLALGGSRTCVEMLNIAELSGAVTALITAWLEVPIFRG
jgi:transposase-like protein